VVVLEELSEEQEAAVLLALLDLQTFSTILLEQALQRLVIPQVAQMEVTRMALVEQEE
jgi:hypothetical protein